MSKSPNKTLIGAFTAGAVALLLLATAIFGSGILFRNTGRFVLFFEKSISGLSVGSPVVFQGVPVGRVVAIHLDGDLKKMSFFAPVFVELNLKNPTNLEQKDEDMDMREYLEALIRHGLRASLATQSLLTGQLMVELSFVPGSRLTPEQTREYLNTPQIPTVPSTLDNIWHKLKSLPFEQISQNILAISEGLERAVNNGHLQGTLDKLDELLLELRGLSGTVDSTFKSFRALADNYTGLADSIEPRLSQILEQATKAVTSVSTAAHQAQKTMVSAGGLVDGNGLTVMELNRALREVSEAARAVRILANTVERNPEILLRGKGAQR